MIHSRKLPRHPRHTDSRALRKFLLLPAVGICIAFGSCSDQSAPPPPPPVAITDTKPVGDGLTVMGFAMVAAAVVLVLGRLLR